MEPDKNCPDCKGTGEILLLITTKRCVCMDRIELDVANVDIRYVKLEEDEFYDANRCPINPRWLSDDQAFI